MGPIIKVAKMHDANIKSGRCESPPRRFVIVPRSLGGHDDVYETMFFEVVDVDPVTAEFGLSRPTEMACNGLPANRFSYTFSAARLISIERHVWVVRQFRA